jgi:hypothetical protein
MTRQSRKRFERIHLRRAKAGFPRVSPAILRDDGTIEAAPRARYQVKLSPTFRRQLLNLPAGDQKEIMQTLPAGDQKEIMQTLGRLAENPYRGRRIIASPIERVHDWLLWLCHELRLWLPF